MSAQRLIVFFAVAAPALGLATHGAARTQDKVKKLPDEAVKILEAAEQIEVVSIDPDDGKAQPKELGSTLVKDAAKRKQVLEAMYKSVAEGKKAARCFEPRHILRASSGGKTVEMVICFACSQMHLQVDGKDRQVIIIGTSAEPLLTQVLKDAGVPLPKN